MVVAFHMQLIGFVLFGLLAKYIGVVCLHLVLAMWNFKGKYTKAVDQAEDVLF